jgi:hypothetical protein
LLLRLAQQLAITLLWLVVVVVAQMAAVAQAGSARELGLALLLELLTP